MLKGYYLIHERWEGGLDGVTEAQILAGRSPVPEAAPEPREVTDTQEAQRDGDGLSPVRP